MTTETKKDILLTYTFSAIMDAWQTGKRRIFLEGGTTSSKTYSTMQFLKFLLESWKGEPLLATVTSESMPHLKGGAILDLFKIMGDEIQGVKWNSSESFCIWPNGCKLEFKSDDQPGKWAGPRRDIWFLNEMPHIHHRSYMEGDIRTRMFTIGDWNPYGEFWFHDDKLADVEENVYIHGLTFRDAPETISNDLIRTLERFKDTDPNYYRVHWLGLLGDIEGLVLHGRAVDRGVDVLIFLIILVIVVVIVLYVVISQRGQGGQYK